jgi:alpha-glucosidase
MEYGKMLSFVQQDNKVRIRFEQQPVVVEVVKDDIINFFVPTWSKEHRSKAIEGNKAKPTDYRVERTEEGLTISTDKLLVKIADGFVVDVYRKDGTLLMSDYRGSRTKEERISPMLLELLESEGHDTSTLIEKDHAVETLKALDPADCFYGLGDKTGFLNKRHYEYENWNTDNPQAHTEDFHALYKSIPFLICLKETGVYGLFFDNTFHSYFNIGKENDSYFYYAADGGNLDYYFLGGDSMPEVIGNYTYLTGTTPLPQLWTLGYQQCRWGYECAEDIREVAHKFREYAIPCESVQYDIDYMDGYKVFTWNEERYGKAGELFAELAKLGFKPVVIIDPGTKLEPGYFMYEEGMQNDYFAKDKDGEVYVNAVWPGDANFPDFGRSKVRQWWGEHHKFLTDLGVAGIWNDMNEPASFHGELPQDVVFHDEDRETNHAEMHNVYGHFMSRATFEGVKKLTGKRPFVITRACYAGTQKYSSVWTGDNQSLWAHLRMMIPQLCNLGMSGFAICGTDIGGFGADTTPELLTRWIEAAVFSPFFRNHSAKGSRRQEPWVFGEATADIYRKYVNLRYQFLPYLYDLFYRGEQTGLPIMRPLVLHYENDPEVKNLNGEFLVGESILVAPVLEQGETRKLVYLPEGIWYDYWTGERISGKQYILREAPLDVCPIYIKAGSVIPTYDVVQYVGEKPYDSLTLLVTPEAGACEHFRDNGEDYAYREGTYNLYRFTTDGTGNISTELLHDGYETYRSITARMVGK